MQKIEIPNQRFSLVNNEVRDNAVHAIAYAHEVSEKPINVIITTQQETRSHAQNRLYWKWLTEWSNHIGDTKESCHLFFKFEFLTKIYIRDDVGYKNMAVAVKNLKGTKNYPSIKQQVIKLTSTRTASTKQMAEYLKEIYQFCYDQGVLLTIPQDLQWVNPINKK